MLFPNTFNYNSCTQLLCKLLLLQALNICTLLLLQLRWQEKNLKRRLKSDWRDPILEVHVSKKKLVKPLKNKYLSGRPSRPGQRGQGCELGTWHRGHEGGPTRPLDTSTQKSQNLIFTKILLSHSQISKTRFPEIFRPIITYFQRFSRFCDR